MKQLAYIVILLIGLMACGQREEYRDALQRAEAVMDENPDSALLILNNLGQHKKEFGKHFRMQYLLHRTNAQNKTNMKFTSDSVAKELVDHFDNHSTTNERVLAHYLLGRAYSDMGEAPKAINSFQDAINVADTTTNDFDFYTLGCVYSQMATVYHRQLLLTNEIDARKKASHYAFRAKKTQWAIYSQVMSAGAYILLNKKDSAELILKSALEQYRKHGYIRQAIRYSRPLIHLYTENPQRLAEAKILMDQYESESDLFDEHHELPPSHRLYYYYKGKYYEGVHKLDSAEYYYRKVYRPGMSYTSLDPMYRGLLSVFSQRHQADSIAKYAQLYCMANDSSIALKDRDAIAQMTASYNYNRMQKEAHESDVKAYRNLIGLIITGVVLGVFIIAALLKWNSYKQKINRLKTEFADATEEYEKNLKEMERLELTHKQVIATIQQELTDTQNESSDIKEKYSSAQQTISNINQNYEAEKYRLLEENKELKKRIDELQKEDVIAKHLEVSEAFAKEEIVKRMREIADKRVAIVKEEEWNELIKAFVNSYPVFFHDLSQKFNTTQHIRVCILTALGIGVDEQANMMGITKQRVSNTKKSINKAIFNEESSRTLYKNLVNRYNIYRIGNSNPSQKH